MKTVLTGIQPTGKLHIGNYYGAIKPTIGLSNVNKTLLFIADLHSLTSIEEAKIRQDNTYSLLASLIALGFDFKKNILFKQSDIPEVTELMFYLTCLTQFNTLEKAHAFQSKTLDNTNTVNAGVFTYPVLMAADILLYDADIIPVGKDQAQHLEITRTLANKFNVLYGKTFTVPEPYIIDKTKTIIGTDGRKMSKSYSNTIDPFAKEDELKKTIYRIKTSSAAANDPKDPDTCTIFQLFSLFAFETEIEDMRDKYAEGISYAQVKQKLFELIMDEFAEERDLYNKIIDEKKYLDAVLITGKLKAREISTKKIKEIKSKLGF